MRMSKTTPGDDSLHDASWLRSVTRAFDLLDAIGSSEDAVDLTTVARRAHLHPATALRYLRSLVHRGYVHHDAEGGYRLGARLFELGTVYAESLSVSHHAEQLARELAA